MAGALQDGPEAFAPIVWRYKETVFGVVLARLGHFEDAEDITQKVLVEAWQRLEKLADPQRLGPWLRSIALHRAIDHLRRGEPATCPFDEETTAAPQLGPDDELERSELQQEVRTAIRRLAPTLRETVVLYYLSGYRQEEVARILEVPLGTVKYRLYTARLKLSEALLDTVGSILRDQAPKEDLGERVFQLLNLHGKGRPDWNAVETELRRIGGDGMEGFIRAFAQPHARTRSFALNMIEYGSPSPTEELIELLKKGLQDSNKKVRTWAAATLLDVDVAEQRKREEFVPLVVPLLDDPSRRVRRAVTTHWIMGDAIYEYPLEEVVVAMTGETDPRARENLEKIARVISERRLLASEKS